MKAASSTSTTMPRRTATTARTVAGAADGAGERVEQPDQHVADETTFE
jgi:hypothetical protein